MNPTGAPDEASIRRALQSGIEHHDAGRLEKAEAIYRRVLELAPGRADAAVLLGDIAHRTGRHDEALELLRRAVAANPSVPNIQNKLGLVLAERGDLRGAVGAFRKALQLNADYAEAYLNLGNALGAQGQHEEALAAYRRAVAKWPRSAEAHNNLAATLEALGRVEEALSSYRTALQIEERAEFRANFAHCLQIVPRFAADAALRPWLARALGEAWARPSDLARPAIALILSDPALREPIEAALRAWPERPDAAALFGRSGLEAFARDPLVTALLENAQVPDWRLERFFTLARHALLAAHARVDEGEDAEERLAFACALARQCFLDDYVFACTDEELVRAQTLAREVESALACASPVAPQSLAIVAAYFPLRSLSGAQSLLERSWPEPLRALLVQQVDEPAAEQALRDGIPGWTAIEDDVSRRVRRQYEESPYPRWVHGAAPRPLALEAHLRRLFPGIALAPPGPVADRDILVAGCGTGQESVELALQYPESRLVAIDLSLASLAYARRKTRELGLANVEYVQADIAALGDIGRRFDLISCVGVLHHLADPAAGWRRLAALLRPGGFMQVGLYSEAGRRDLAAARALIAERGYRAVPADIRRCRLDLLDSGNFPRLALLRDLYGMNECRDLLFHVQEHRFTLPQLHALVEAIGLEWVGLAVSPALARQFAQRFPRASRSDPDAWHAFEEEFPDTFAGMYLFWVRKRGEP